MNFNEKTVLVTGGSRGIGRATALAFARHGARVAINYHRKEEAAQATLEAMEGEGHLALKGDVADPEAVRRLVDQVVDSFGRLDIVVNNAGIFRAHPIDDTSYDAWQQAWQETLAINLLGPANVCHCCVPHMIRQGGGRIINVSSRGAFRGEPDQPAYGASKAGLNAMSQSLAKALARHNIFVGVVAPGFTATDMALHRIDDEIRNQSPLGRVAKPEEVAYGVLFLASQGAEFMTGAILDVNGASYLRS